MLCRPVDAPIGADAGPVVPVLDSTQCQLMAPPVPREEMTRGVILPGNRTVEFREFPIPKPQHGQVLVKMMASGICGSDIRAIYRGHTGVGAEAYVPGTIAGHEPCGDVAAVGPGCRALKTGDRVAVYHISGCGVCDDCREGYKIS